MFKNRGLYAFTLAEGATHVGISHNNRRIAFTLAEVLITLGIIGVVAVLTLPNLMSDYRKKTYVAQLQRVYNQIQTAAQNCMADEDVDDLGDTYLKYNSNWGADIKRSDYDSDEAYNEAWNEARSNMSAATSGRFLKKYFRVTKDCGHINSNEENDCIAESYKNIRGEEDRRLPLYSDAAYCVNVNTGATICMDPFDYSYSYGYCLIDVDTNGKAGPNTWGRDAFHFAMDSKGNLSEPIGNAAAECLDGGYGATCFDRIIENGWKMDY